MKTIGLIGGMSWESTSIYYRVLNETVRQQLGGLASAQCLLYSVNFQEIEQYQAKGDWDRSAEVLTDAALRLERAGADFIVICTNTMHKIVPYMQERLQIPILHIADATADELQSQSLTNVGLLATRYTMEQDFYKQRLLDRGIEVLIPDEADCATIHTIIYDELCMGILREESRRQYVEIIDTLKHRGAQAVILGCTEIGLLIDANDTDLPLFDTAWIHANRAALLSLE